MTTKTYLAGKDAALEDTIEKALQMLRNMELEVAPISWLNPAPHCWSVHLQETSCPHLYTNGKGTSKPAALASGYGEFFERLASDFFFSDYLLEEDSCDRPFRFYPNEFHFPVDPGGPIPQRDRQGTELLNTFLRSFYDPEGELEAVHLLDNNSHVDSRSICTLPFTSLATEKTTYFPVAILNNLYVSNGMAAGNSPPESWSQALSEIVERYVKNIIISKGISLPEVPAAYLVKYPRLCTILDSLGGHGFAVRIKDASLGGKFPVICALLADRESGGVFAAFGANCRFETAVERTLTELLQGRSADQMRDFQPPCHDINLAADPHNLESHFVDSDGLLSWQMFTDKSDFRFCPWDFDGTSLQEFRRLKKIISRCNFDIYQAEYLHTGMYCCRFLVPGMSEIYPVEDLRWNNRNSGNILRPFLLRLNRMNRSELGIFFNLLDSLNFNDHHPVSSAIGILFDRKSAWSTLRFGELKALTLLAMGDYHEAADWCTWTLHNGELDHRRRRLYRLLHTLLNFFIRGENSARYSNSLRDFYLEDELRAAEAVVAGKNNFPGLNFAGSWTDISPEHHNMLNMYRRLSRFKMKCGEPQEFRGKRQKTGHH